MGDLLSPRENQLLRRIATQKTDEKSLSSLEEQPKRSHSRIRLLSKLQISSETEIAEAAGEMANL